MYWSAWTVVASTLPNEPVVVPTACTAVVENTLLTFWTSVAFIGSPPTAIVPASTSTLLADIVVASILPNEPVCDTFTDRHSCRHIHYQ